MKPLAVDICCGVGGWAEGLLAEGWDVVGVDIERHEYGEHRYPAMLVIQNALTLHGAQFKSAKLLVASPPCQFFSYCAMPWSRSKQLAAEVRADPCRQARELALFKACFRIQREACEAAGRHIPLIVENVCGAQPWVGTAQAHFGSFYLWGDVPLPQPGLFGDEPRQQLRLQGRCVKATGMNWSDQTKRGQDFTRIAGRQAGIKAKDADGYERSHPNALGWKGPRTSSGNTTARKAASALIAKIPLPLSRHIAATFRP